MNPDSLAARARAAVERAEAWLRAAGEPPVCAPPAPAAPTLPWSTDAAGCADSAAALSALLVLAVRDHDLDALATVLRRCGYLGRTGAAVPRRAVGFLVLRQQPDGGFGAALRGTDPATVAAVRAALTRNCAAALSYWTG